MTGFAPAAPGSPSTTVPELRITVTAPGSFGCGLKVLLPTRTTVPPQGPPLPVLGAPPFRPPPTGLVPKLPGPPTALSEKNVTEFNVTVPAATNKAPPRPAPPPPPPVPAPPAARILASVNDANV